MFVLAPVHNFVVVFQIMILNTKLIWW